MAINRDKLCDDIHGGNTELYVFEYVKYSRSSIAVVDNYLTQFPATLAENLNPSNITFSEAVDVEEGGVV